jgi:hypothetical protein
MPCEHSRVLARRRKRTMASALLHEAEKITPPSLSPSKRTSTPPLRIAPFRPGHAVHAALPDGLQVPSSDERGSGQLLSARRRVGWLTCLAPLPKLAAAQAKGGAQLELRAPDEGQDRTSGTTVAHGAAPSRARVLRQVLFSAFPCANAMSPVTQQRESHHLVSKTNIHFLVSKMQEECNDAHVKVLGEL